MHRRVPSRIMGVVGVHALGLLLATSFIALGCFASRALADAAFPVKPPSELPFEWPRQPDVGTSEYFAIAAPDGTGRSVAKCEIVYENVYPVSHAALVLRDYLQKVTGATINAYATSHTAPPGIGQIHVGNTSYAASIPLNLPDVNYVAANLVADSSFEDAGWAILGFNGPSAPVPAEQWGGLGISVWDSPTCVVSVVRDENAHWQAFALKFQGAEGQARLRRTAQVEPLRSYTVGLWVRRDTEDGACRMSVRSMNAQSQETELASVAIAPTSGQWRRIAATVQMPADAVSLHLDLWLDGQGADSACLVDDFFVRQATEANEDLPNLNGYLIRTVTSDRLVIKGGSPYATASGVVSFLRRYVGVNQYWHASPAALDYLGTALPAQRPSLSVEEVEWRDWPYWYSRSQSNQRFPTNDAGPYRLAFYRPNLTMPCSENYGDLLPPSVYGATHPEYYPLIGGVRKVPSSDGNSGWQPCVSNPGVVQAVAQAVCNYFAANPRAPAMNVSINDGGGDCECENCRAMDAPDTNYGTKDGMGDRYVKFTNQVTEMVLQQYPDKRIVYLAYGGAASAPRTVTPHPAIIPVLTHFSLYPAFDAWYAMNTRGMGIYRHHDDSIYFVLPKVTPHQIARDILYATGSQRALIYYGEVYAIWPITGINSYVISEMLWDPRRDVDELIARYCNDLFGNAATHMRDFYAALESGVERWLNATAPSHWYGKSVSAIYYGNTMHQYKVLNHSEAQQAESALAAAEGVAQGEDVLERIAVVRAAFDLQKRAAAQYWHADDIWNLNIASPQDAQLVVDKSRTIVSLASEIRSYIADVLESPNGFAKYNLFRTSAGADITSYAMLKASKLHDLYVSAITNGADRATDYLVSNHGRNYAVGWWLNVISTEADPFLRGVWEAQLIRASGAQMPNLLDAKDPGFEILGQTKVIPPAEEWVMPWQRPYSLDSVSAVYFQPEYVSPARVVVQKAKVHSGTYALTFENCHKGRIDKWTSVPGNARYRASIWVNRTNDLCAYSFQVWARGSEETSSTLYATCEVPGIADRWICLAADIVLPDTYPTYTVFLRLYRDSHQTGGASIAIDDFYLGQYPSDYQESEAIVDNSDPGFQILSGTWQTSTGVPGYYGSNYAYASTIAEQTPTARVRWSYGNLRSGLCKVYARWTAHSGRSTCAPYVIKDGQSELATVRADQTKNGGTFNLLGTFVFTAGGHAVELHNGASRPGNYIVADAVRFEWVDPATLGAIRATIEPQGARDAGAQWRVDNGPWQSSGATVGNLPAGEHVVTYKEVPGWLTPSPQTLTVTAGRTAETTGTYEAVPPPTEMIVDNTDAGFAVVSGTWKASSSVPGYYGSNYLWASTISEATPTARARWTCGVLPAGTYRVFARWTANTDRSKSAAYVIKDGQSELATVRVDQTKNGGTFNLLGTFAFAAGGHAVELHNGASRPGTYIVADAVRFEWIDPAALGAIRATIEPQGARDAGAQWRVDNGPWQPSGATVGNLTPGEHVVSYKDIPGWATPPAQSVTVAAGTTATVTGTYQSLPPPSECTIDNSDPGFTVLAGTWNTSKSVSGYYGTNYAWATTTSDASPTARVRWTCTILSAGTYRVYARWTANSERSKSAPYVIKDGATELATVRVDQTRDGGAFNLLGTFAFSSGGHTVELHNGASRPGTYIIADAVRFELVAP